MEENQKYKVPVYCKNCGFRDKTEIEKGTVVEQQECPECGCAQLIRDRNVKTDKYYNVNL